MDRSYKWYLSNLENLYKKYGRSFVAIKDCSVIGCYKSYAEGVKETLKKEKIGTFIVEEVCNSIDECTSCIATVGF